MVVNRVVLWLVQNRKLSVLYRKIFSPYIYYLQKELSGSGTVLDLGCEANSPIQYCHVSFSMGVELYEPYLQESMKRGIHNQYIRADIRKVEFKPKCFDVVVALDVLEHLTNKEGYELIKKMEKWARKKIVIFTPNGYIRQDNFNGNPLQLHKSGWNVQELNKLGFKVFGINGLKILRGYKGSIKYKPTLLWNIISDLSQKITYRYPKSAFQLLAVKQKAD